MADIFDNIRVNAGDTAKSYTWYQTKLKQLGGNNVSANQLMGETKNLTTILNPGGMYLFMYDPKHKATLPYYDIFPLVLPFRKVPDGFYGINLHYLPYVLRFRVLQELLKIANKNRQSETIALSWSLLNSVASLEAATVCVKHYLTKQIRSRFLEINKEDWLTASQLPLEGFRKATNKTVWTDTIKKI